MSSSPEVLDNFRVTKQAREKDIIESVVKMKCCRIVDETSCEAA